MQVLLSNDDGIHAPGLAALYQALHDVCEVTVVAPDSERSGAGHSITVSTPLQFRKCTHNGFDRAFAVNGTPADCVKLATNVILNQRPAAIVSGINLGANVGVSVLYSGTVSAATEGALLGIPSIAISLDAHADPDWDTAARIARILLMRVVEHGLKEGVFLNVNVPKCSWSELRGMAVTRIAHSRFNEVFHKRTGPHGREYYWLDGTLKLLSDANGTDVAALENDVVSITPVGLDRTDHSAIPRLREWNLELGGK